MRKLLLALVALRCSALVERLLRECETFSRAYSSETSYQSLVLGSNKTNLQHDGWIKMNVDKSRE